MTAAASIITKVFNALEGSAVAAWCAGDKATSTVLNAANAEEAIWLIGMLAYQVSARTGAPVKDVLREISRVVYYLESEKPKMEDES